MKNQYFDIPTQKSVIGDLKLVLSADFPSGSRNSTDEPPLKKAKSIFKFAKGNPQVGSLDKEISAYLLQDMAVETVCPLFFWKSNASKFPTLCKLAKRYLSFPASSAPVERIFSSTGKIFRADRCKLSDDLFSKLAFLKCNKEYNKRE